jgi:DNA-binding transcriptional LysR family regulator
MEIAVQTNSLRVQKQLVLAGHGWTVLPGVGIAEDVANGSLSAAPLCEPDVQRSIVLGTPRYGRVPPAVAVVARELVRRITEAVSQERWPSAQLQTSEEPEAEV